MEGFGLLRGVMVDWRRKRFFDVARLDFGEMSFGEVDRPQQAHPPVGVFFRMTKWGPLTKQTRIKSRVCHLPTTTCNCS